MTDILASIVAGILPLMLIPLWRKLGGWEHPNAD